MNISAKSVSAEIRVAVAVSIVVGLWVIISPFVLRIPIGSAMLWSNIAVGAAVIAAAIIGGWTDGAILGAIVPLSAWLFASTFILNFFNTHFLWSNVVSAFVLIFEGAYSGALRSFPSPRGQS